MLFLDSGFGAGVRGASGEGRGLRRTQAETAFPGALRPPREVCGGEGAACCRPVHRPGPGVEATAGTPEGRRPHVRRRDQGRWLQVSRRPGWGHCPPHGSGGPADPWPPGTSSRPSQSRTGLELGPKAASRAPWAAATSVGAPSRAPGRSLG